MKVNPLLGIPVGVLTVAAVIVVWWLGNTTFCDLVLVLDATVDVGEDIYRAMEDFYNKITDGMVAALPDDLRPLAESLVAVVDGILSCHESSRRLCSIC